MADKLYGTLPRSGRGSRTRVPGAPETTTFVFRISTARAAAHAAANADDAPTVVPSAVFAAHIAQPPTASDLHAAVLAKRWFLAHTGAEANNKKSWAFHRAFRHEIDSSS